MTTWLCFVVLSSALLNSEVKTASAAAVATAPVAAVTNGGGSACSLLTSCLNASDQMFADCDSILDQYKPPCWSDMKSVVAELRQVHSTESAQINSCLLTNSNANDNAMTFDFNKQCQSMYASYQHIATQEGWASRKKRDTSSKDWNNFYKCIASAQRHHSICKQLADCCPKDQMCTWQNALQPVHSSVLNLKVELFGIRQKCVAGLQPDQATDYDHWNILDGQPIWNGNSE